jgi:hypothetical protein
VSVRAVQLLSIDGGQGPRLLPYDLNILHEYVRKKDTGRLVIAFQDSEAFDQNLLNDLLSLIRYGGWTAICDVAKFFQFLA